MEFEPGSIDTESNGVYKAACQIKEEPSLLERGQRKCWGMGSADARLIMRVMGS